MTLFGVAAPPADARRKPGRDRCARRNRLPLRLLERHARPHPPRERAVWRQGGSGRKPPRRRRKAAQNRAMRLRCSSETYPVQRGGSLLIRRPACWSPRPSSSAQLQATRPSDDFFAAAALRPCPGGAAHVSTAVRLSLEREPAGTAPAASRSPGIGRSIVFAVTRPHPQEPFHRFLGVR